MVVVGILLVWYILTAGGSTPERWIRYMLTAFLVTFTSNFLFNLFSRIDTGTLSYYLCWFFKTLFHIGLIVGTFTWCGYADTEAGHQNYARRDKRNPHYIPFIIPILFMIINLKTHWAFSIDSELNYVRGWMYQLEMIYLIIASSCLSLSLIYANRKEQDPHKMRHILVTASFPIAMLVGWLLSFIGEGVPVICVAITIEILCLALGNSNIRISVDKLTMVNNRNNLIGFINYKIKNNNGNLYLLMLDIDRFKSINDNYGHLIGDQALVRVTEVLKIACNPYDKRPYIARYGGDEFIIVLEAEYSEVNELCSIINKLMSLESQKTEYKLSVSIGVAKYEEGMTYSDFINKADSELYKVKNKRVLN